MKAKVKETGDIIEVYTLYSVIYSRLDCNGKIIEEYDEDELDFNVDNNPVELTESEDERIRKELVKHLKEGAEGYEPAGNCEDYKRWLSWLEKHTN